MVTKSQNQAPTMASVATAAPSTCTMCGIVFAKKEVYDQHMQVFHDPRYTSTAKICEECGVGVESLQQHLVEHDIGRLIIALYLDISKERQGQGSLLLPPPTAQSSLAAPSENAAPEPKSPQSPEEKESRAPSRSSVSSRVRVRPSLRPPSVTAQTSVPEPKRRGRKRKAQPSRLSISPTPSRASTRRSVSPAPSTSSHRSDRPPAKLAKLASPRATPKPPAMGGPVQTLGDKCIFCGEVLQKPWELVSHMANSHDIILEHIIKTEVTEFSEDQKKLNRPKCPYCSITPPTTHACLLHILKEHRMLLFCSVQKGGLCTVVIGMVSDDDKRYTITVRVKPKNT